MFNVLRENSTIEHTPISLGRRRTVSGNYYEWFLVIDGEPVYEATVRGVFTTADCSPGIAFDRIMKRRAASW